jgi:hypothetical protein
MTALLPPTPAAVTAYFTRRRSAIAEFTPEDLASNERLWRVEICGLPESAAPAAVEAENGGSRSAEASPVVQSPDPPCGHCGQPPCRACGQPFQPRREWSRYCSASCKQRAKRARRGNIGHADWVLQTSAPEAAELAGAVE